MDVNHVLFEFFGLKITYLSIGAALVGAIPAIAALHRAYDWWATKEERHLALLHKYLDQEEKNISGRRREVLTSIGLLHHSYLDDKKLDVGFEIDQAILQLDHGRPDRAKARISELLKKVRSNSEILKRRTEDLRKHERSLNIFLAAIAENEGHHDAGLDYTEAALRDYGYDLDALRLKGSLLLKKGDLDLAEQTFNRLLQNTTGNKFDKAEAQCGLAQVYEKHGVEHYDVAANHLNNALNNINGLPPSEQSPLTKSIAHQFMGRLYKAASWPQHDRSTARQHFEKSLNALDNIKGRSAGLRSRTNELRREIQETSIH